MWKNTRLYNNRKFEVHPRPSFWKPVSIVQGLIFIQSGKKEVSRENKFGPWCEKAVPMLDTRKKESAESLLVIEIKIVFLMLKGCF
jgi:hypothetical protein